MNALSRIKQLERKTHNAGRGERQREILKDMFARFERGEKPPEEYFKRNQLEGVKALFY